MTEEGPARERSRPEEPTEPEDPAEPEDSGDTSRLGGLVAEPPAVRSIALTGLFVLALFYTLYFARAVVLPIVLATLLSFLFAPVVRTLKRLRVPEPLGAALVLLGFVGTVGFGVVRLAEPAAQWVERAPQSLRRVEYKLRDIKRPVEQVQKAAEEVQKVAAVNAEPQRQVTVERSTFSETLFSQTREFLAGVVVLIVLVYFLLASGDLFLRKLVRVIPRLEDKKRAVEIARQTQQDISRYLFTVSVVNALLGGLVSAAMYLLGLPNPILWGVLAGLLNFVPYLGALAMVVILAILGLLTFDDLGRAMLVPGVFILLNHLEAYILTPIVLGRRLMLNTVVIFVGIIFWGWMWGIPGAILAVPILAAFKILCDHIEPLRPVGEFLGR